jgi:hypothetical protein
MQPARELAVMSRAILALLCKGTNIQLLADDDQALNLATNVQLSNAAPDVQEQSKQHPAANIVRRLSILRRNILWSFVILASAVIAYRCSCGTLFRPRRSNAKHCSASHPSFPSLGPLSADSDGPGNLTAVIR